MLQSWEGKYSHTGHCEAQGDGESTIGTQPFFLWLFTRDSKKKKNWTESLRGGTPHLLKTVLLGWSCTPRRIPSWFHLDPCDQGPSPPRRPPATHACHYREEFCRALSGCLLPQPRPPSCILSNLLPSPSRSKRTPGFPCIA